MVGSGMRLGRLVLVVCLGLAGCAPPQATRSVPTGSSEVRPRTPGAADATVEIPTDVALKRAVAALGAQGLTVSSLPGPSGTVEATKTGAVEPDWAECPIVTVRDPFSEAFRSRRKQAGELSTKVTVSVSPAAPGSTKITVRSLFLGTYINDYTGNPQQAACRSTGVLEQAVLAEIRGGG